MLSRYINYRMAGKEKSIKRFLQPILIQGVGKYINN